MPETPRLRIALTGCRTFFGDRLIQALEDDPRCEHIIVFDVRPPLSGRTKTRFMRVDLTDPSSDELMEALLREEQIDTLVHTAFLAYPSHSRSWAHELEAIGSLYVMNAAASAKVRKVVLTSTTAVYGAYPSNPAFLSEEHALKGIRASRWVMDRVAVEKDLARLRHDCPEMITTSLRFCMTVGPTVRNFYTKLLTPQFVPAVLGYDPLMQYLHEDDATAALLKAVHEDHAGAYNIVGAGTIYYSDVIRLGGKIGMPVPHFFGYAAADALFNVQLSVVPGSFLDYFRFAWVADGKKMHENMGFSPQFTSRGALLSFFDSISAGAATRRPEQAL